MTKYRSMAAARSKSIRLALLAGAAAPAHAANPLDPDHATEHVKVRFGDLDLSSTKGAKQLYMRIHNAAETVCGEYDPLDLYDLQGARKCQDEAIGEAVAQVNRPLLTAVCDRNHPHA